MSNNTRNLACTCQPYGTLHHPTCSVSYLLLEVARRQQLGWDAVTGYVSFSPGYLRRMEREEAKALRGERCQRRYVRPEVQRLCQLPPTAVKARNSRVKRRKVAGR
jgi:hypothetical protein